MNDEIKIYNWNEICEDFKNSRLIVGNGLSIQFNTKFNNQSLLDSMLEFLEQKDVPLLTNDDFHIDDIVKCKRILEVHKGVNAELVRFRIEQIEQTLDLLDSEIDPNSKEKYKEFFKIQDKLLKYVFIRVIQDKHPLYCHVKQNLCKYHEFIKTFKYVFSLNYDLVIYWLFMSLLNESESICCDGFSREKHDGPLTFSLSNIKPDRIGFFYLHGNICLHKDEHNTIIKCVKSESDLLTEIRSNIDKEGLPFLISEGSSEKKEEAIQLEKDYTSVVYEELLTNKYPSKIFGKEYIADNSLVIYGCSLDNDHHIIHQALKSGCKRIAISKFIKLDPYYNLMKILGDKKKEKDIQVICFDSKSIFSKKAPESLQE